MVGGAGVFFGILEFPASLRGSKATEARNSRFYLKFPTMSSPPSLTGGSLSGDDTRLGNSRISSDFC